MKTLRPLVVLNRGKRYNWMLHQGFLSWPVSQEGMSAFYYGPRAAYIDPECRIPFDNGGLPIQQVADRVDANIVILYRAGYRDLNWVEPFACSLPVVVVDVDFCYLRNSDDRLSANADLHLLRNPSDVPFSPNKSSGVLPHSIDPNVFRPAPGSSKRAGICYVGHTGYTSTNYRVRSLARQTLHNVDVPRKKLGPKAQVQFYGRHLAALTCSCQWHYLNAKHFEIPATGTVLFTNGQNGISQYLPSEYYIQYRDDCTDLPDKWRDVQTNKDQWLKTASEAAEYVRRTASHQARWEDLVHMVNASCKTDFTLP